MRCLSIDTRCLRMFDRGLVEEVSRILADGHSPDVKPFESIGYAEALSLVRGETTRDEAIVLARRNTRRYAKRQWTWFLRESGVTWVDGFGDETEPQRNVVEICNRFLATFTDFTRIHAEQNSPPDV